MGTKGFEERRERRRKEGRKLEISREGGGGRWVDGESQGLGIPSPLGGTMTTASRPSIEPSQVARPVLLLRHRSLAWYPLW